MASIFLSLSKRFSYITVQIHQMMLERLSLQISSFFLPNKDITNCKLEGVVDSSSVAEFLGECFPFNMFLNQLQPSCKTISMRDLLKTSFEFKNGYLRKFNFLPESIYLSKFIKSISLSSHCLHESFLKYFKVHSY